MAMFALRACERAAANNQHNDIRIMESTFAFLVHLGARTGNEGNVGEVSPCGTKYAGMPYILDLVH